MIKLCPICESEHEDTHSACPKQHKSRPGKNGKDPLIGSVVRERYQISEMLGKGAMGVVYKATQVNDGKEAAIKVLHTHLSSDPESIKRFQHEARAASSLMHPHIVRLYDVGMIPGGQPYIAMEFLSGKTLADYIREKKVFTTKEAIPIIRQVCEALAEAHSHGVLHRDIKPANIMLMNRFGQENFVVVLDFSISKVIQKVSDVDTTTPGLIFGSPAYMSPERFMGKGGDFRADIYSLGIIMFQMLAGRAPFKASDLYTLMNEHVGTVPPRVKDVRPDSDIPDSLEETIARALAKKPEDRHANIKALLNEINDVYLETSTLVNPIPVLDPLVGGMDRLPPAPMDNARRTPEGNFAVYSSASASTSGSSPATSSSSSIPAANVFDIDPGLTPTIGIPNYSSSMSSQQRKALSLEDTYQAKLPELAGSGKFDKSLIVKTDRQRPSIRPPEKSGKLSLELIALAVVLLLGTVAVGLTLIPQNSFHSKIATLIKQDNLPAAAAMLRGWRPSDRDVGEQELYADSCVALGRAYYKKHDLSTAADMFDMVPAGTVLFKDAHDYSRRCRKDSGN